MNGQMYDKDLQDLLEKVTRQTNSDLKESLDVYQKLYHEAETRQDSHLMGIACFSLGECCYRQGMAEKSYSYLSRGMQSLDMFEEWELLSRSYNMIALLLQFRGNFMHAADYFMEGIKIAQDHGIMENAAILCNNFSALCESVQEYEEALQYREMGMVLLQGCNDVENKDERLLIIRARLLRLYMRMGQTKNASAEMKHLEAGIEQMPQFADIFAVAAIQLEYARKNKNIEKEILLREKALKAFFNCKHILEYFEESMMLANDLVEIKAYSDAEKVLNAVEEIVGKELYTELLLRVLQYKIEIYEQQNREKELGEATRKYFHLSCSQRAEMKKSYCSVLQLRSELRQEEVNNIFLTLKAGTDELTGIPNRRKLNEEADRMFEKAYKEGKPLGVEMLDIDRFKNCNDTYGHQMGDRCIRKLADALNSIKGKNVFCARYGGDEFVVLYYNMCDEEILENCKVLQESAYKIGEELGLGKISISQGIINRIPGKGNRIWDFTAAADETLYWVKEHSRDDFRLIHHKNDL